MIFLHIKALELSDLSIIAPLSSLTPVLILLFSPFITGNMPGLFGILGVFIITVGLYTLEIASFKVKWYAPFIHLFRHKGTKFVLLEIVLWALAENLNKIGVMSVSGIYWAILMNVSITLLITPLLIWYFKKNRQQGSVPFGSLLLLGLFSFISSLFHFIALELTYVAYVLLIKRSSVVLTVVLANLSFSEPNFWQRMIGTVIILLGIFLILFS